MRRHHQAVLLPGGFAWPLAVELCVRSERSAEQLTHVLAAIGEGRLIAMQVLGLLRFPIWQFGEQVGMLIPGLSGIMRKHALQVDSGNRARVHDDWASQSRCRGVKVTQGVAPRRRRF